MLMVFNEIQPLVYGPAIFGKKPGKWVNPKSENVAMVIYVWWWCWRGTWVRTNQAGGL